MAGRLLFLAKDLWRGGLERCTIRAAESKDWCRIDARAREERSGCLGTLFRAGLQQARRVAVFAGEVAHTGFNKQPPVSLCSPLGVMGVRAEGNWKEGGICVLFNGRTFSSAAN
jgi:hypothetical protein